MTARIAIFIVVVGCGLNAIAAKPAAKVESPPEPPMVSSGHGPALRSIALDKRRVKGVYKVNGAPGLATVIELPEPWSVKPTCGDCVFGDAKPEAQLWRVDLFPDARTLSIKPTRLPGPDLPSSAFVTNIDVMLAFDATILDQLLARLWVVGEAIDVEQVDVAVPEDDVEELHGRRQEFGLDVLEVLGAASKLRAVVRCGEPVEQERGAQVGGCVATERGVELGASRVCHWSAAEPITIEKAYASARALTSQEIVPVLPWFDVYREVMVANRAAVAGVFDGRLKSVCRILASDTPPTGPEAIGDGLAAMVAMWRANRETKEATPISSHPLMQQVAAYNARDVRLLAELVRWLRANR